MEDIAFPAWVVNAPAMAVATSLSRHLHDSFAQAARHKAEEAQKLQKVQRELVDADAVHRATTEQNDVGSTASDSTHEDNSVDRKHRNKAVIRGVDAGETESVSSDDSDASRADAIGRARFLFGSHSAGVRRYTRLLARGNGTAAPAIASALTPNNESPSRPYSIPWPGQHSGGAGQAGGRRTDLLDDSRVRLLFRLSRFSDIATGADVMVSPSHATALVALLGCAVNCTTLPEDFTRGFFMECSSLYTALMSRLPALHYGPSVDKQGFVAAVVACGMKLRAILESSRGATGPAGPGAYGAENALLTSSGVSTPRATGLSGHGQSLTLSGFSARIVDPALVACIPNSIDDCVDNPIALGALEGLAYTYSRAPVNFAPELVAHLNNLTDAFALSENRRELAYKKLLSLLLEAMSCSKVIDHERTNNWVTAIIQEDYVVRGLFQREILHARVVAATLTLLIRQYQKLAQECADQTAGIDGVPDFTEGDQLIELVWSVLQSGLSVWNGAHGNALTLYGANVRVVLENLLLVEAERVRCYLVITSATQAYQQRMLAENSMLSMRSTAVTGGGAADRTGAGTLPLYTPLPQEERLRVRIASNVVKFLLMPTSVVNLPNTGSGDAAKSLQRSLTALCARLLRVLCTDHVALGRPGQSVPTASDAIFAADAGTGRAAKAHGDPHNAQGGEDGAVAAVRFSNGYYNQMEQVVRTLIQTVMHGPSSDARDAISPTSATAPTASRRTRAGTLVLAATVCLQSFCATDAHIGGFVVSEVMDAIQAMLRDMTAHAEMPDEETAARLSLCVDTLRTVLVPGGEVPGSELDMAALRRYCQLLSDTYENLLRLEVMENKRVKEAVHHTGSSKAADLLPTLNMRVVADAYWHLTVSLHERLLTLSNQALEVTGDHALQAQYLRRINEEGEAVRVLLTESIQCLLRVAWPGSGVLYQQAGEGGVKVPGAPSAKPASVAPFALAVMSPFFRVIALLLHLATLFPLKRLRGLVAHVEMGPGLLTDDQSDNAMLGYFFQPSKLHTAFHTDVGMAQFRTFWLLLTHYGFTTEALAWSSSTLKLSLAAHTHAGRNAGTGATGLTSDAQHATHPLLTEAQARQIRQMAASATPLLFMQSSDLTQALADIAVLVRYADETTHVAATDGALWRALASHQKCICGRGPSGEANPWKALTVGELVLLRALAHLELLRGLTGSIANLTTYQHFEIREFVASQAMQPALMLVMSAVSACYIATLRALSPSTTHAVVSRDLLQLVLLVGFAIDSERAGAAMILNLIVRTFPALSVHGHALPLLWGIMNVVQSGTAAQIESFCRHVHYDDRPAVDPDVDSTARAMLVEQLTAIATSWAGKALDDAPLALFNLATGFVLQQALVTEDRGDVSRGIGSTLAMQAAQPPDARRQRFDASVATPATLASTSAAVQTIGSARIPSYAQVLIRRSQAQGQVMAAVRFSTLSGVERLVSQQLRRTLASQRHALPYTNFDLLVKHIASTIRAARHPVQGGRGGALAVMSADGGDVNAPAEAALAGAAPGRISELGLSQMESTVSSAAAVLCTGLCSPSAQWQLLHLVIHGPIRYFHSDAIEAAAGAWSWILAADGGSLAIGLLRTLCKSIEWTMSHGLGLFDGVTTSQNLVVQTGDSTLKKAVAARYQPDYSTRSPHSVLLAFLADNFADPTNPQSQRVVVVQTLHSFCLRLVEQLERLSLKDSSFAETMRAMVLVGQVARNAHVMNYRRQRRGLPLAVPFASVGVLRHRWYAAVLRWFRKLPPSWYFAADPGRATQELDVLEALVQLLRDEERAVGRSVTGFLDFSMPVRYDSSSGGVAEGDEADENGPHHRPQPHRRSRDAQSAAAYKITPASMIWTVASAVRHRTAAILDVAEPEVSLRELITDEQKRVTRLLQLLRVLVRHECVRIRVWQTPRRSLLVAPCVPVTSWREHLEAAAEHDPAVVVAMARRFDSIAQVREAAVDLVSKSPELYVTVPEAVDLYLTKEVLDAGAPKLFLFHNCTITQGLRFLDARFSAYPEVGKYAIRSLLSCESEYLIFYLPQLLQVLAVDKSGAIQSFLKRMAAKSVVFCHQLLWSLQTEGEGETELAQRCRALSDQIKKDMSPESKQFYENEFAFTALVTSLSGELMKFDKPQRKPNLRKRLVDAEFHVAPRAQHVYLATDPHYRITEVIPHTAGAMQSAAKCPILVQFRCVPRALSDMRLPAPQHGAGGDGSGATRENANRSSTTANEDAQAALVLPQPDPRDVMVKACIFKMGDDCRQDQISLQLIGLMQRIFDAIDVPSYLYPYRVVTTGQDSGIIEVVPNSVSRNEVGKLVESNLAEYFVQTFGHPESVRFKRARHEFIKSTAAYSIASFILNIKDRHNGNIMIDQKGHLVHIDFGFLFDTSPGGDINFESSPFKLTKEMVQLIGKDVGVSNLRSKSLTKALVDEESYVEFKTLVIRCYLAVRQYAREICILVELMLRSGLPCFKPKQTIANLAKRLAMDMTEIEAAHFMRRRIHEARENYRTRLYDWYQNKFEGIEK